MQIFKRIKNLIKKENKVQGIGCTLSTTKHYMSSNYTLKFSAETEKKKKEINENLKKLIKKYIDTPEKLIQYMKLKGMNVYKIKHADKLLAKIGEEEGFLTPLKGFKALILNFITSIYFEGKPKISFSTKEMFIFNIGQTEIYTIARALHKYYGYKNNLPGFDYKSQTIFKKVYGNIHSGQSLPLANCSALKDLYACKEALARDLESINFTIELSVEYERARKALGILNSTKTTNI